MKTLNGDRTLEWAWVLKKLPDKGKVLDVGCTNSLLPLTIMEMGHDVTGIDIQEFGFTIDRIRFIKEDVVTRNFENDKYDIIVNCSTVEHIGLRGRYGVEEENLYGDIDAMRNLRHAMVMGGIMILTIPVGKDSIFMPLHRVYGPFRIGFLFHGYEIIEEEFWRKDDLDIWIPCDKKTALNEQPSKEYYALGLFVLKGK